MDFPADQIIKGTVVLVVQALIFGGIIYWLVKRKASLKSGRLRLYLTIVLTWVAFGLLFAVLVPVELLTQYGAIFGFIGPAVLAFVNGRRYVATSAG